MDIEALAVHHISEEKAQKEGLDWEAAKTRLISSPENTRLIYIAHNADYEKQFFNPEKSLWIDTYKVALKIYTESPRHSNQVLKYYLGIEDHESHHPPHRALPDCIVTAEILLKMMCNMSCNEMRKISLEPPYLTKISFGKHAGEKFENLPKDYLEWLSGQKNMDLGVISAAKRVLEK